MHGRACDVGEKFLAKRTSVQSTAILLAQKDPSPVKEEEKRDGTRECERAIQNAKSGKGARCVHKQNRAHVTLRRSRRSDAVCAVWSVWVCKVHYPPTHRAPTASTTNTSGTCLSRPGPDPLSTN
jgi:hypothetical protein